MKKIIVLLGAGAIIVGLVVWGFIEGRKEVSLEQERERPVQVPTRVVVQNGDTTVVFDADTQKRADVVVAPMQEMTRRGEIEALATVLPVNELIELRNAYVTAKIQADRTQAAAYASQQEYERVRTLHGDEQNVSTKVLEATEATWRADEAEARGANELLNVVERGARQKWGNALTAAAVGNTPLFQRLSDQKEVLLRVAAPSGMGIIKPPATTRVAANDGTFRTATFISPSPQADPRIQGASFFYAATSGGLLSGTTLIAYLPTGAKQAGGIVPAAAVVWWQGKAWIYLQTAPDRFVRREMQIAMPVEQGWFAPQILKGTQLVVRGAQTMLSEELRSQIQAGEEGK